MLDRDADFCYKLFRITGNTVINEGYFTGKTADLKVVCLYKLHQLPILIRRLQVMSMETDTNTAQLRQRKHRAVKPVGFIQQQEGAVSPR